jgi:murein DD-endopeptidase MepM/ murein hydrolase activator NlpD
VDRRRLQAGGVLLAGVVLVGAAVVLAGKSADPVASAPATTEVASTLAPSTSLVIEPTAAEDTTTEALASAGAAAIAPESNPAAVAEASDTIESDARYGEEVLDQLELDQATAPLEGAEQPARPVNVPLGDERSCPLGGTFQHWYDWLAPRAGGKVHMGHDLIAPMGTPVLAVTDGFVARVDRVDQYSGGMTDRQGVAMAVVSAQGERFFYAHLAEIAPQLQPGSPVVTGQVIGWVGQTGDARMSVPHLHFEWRPDGRTYADPQAMVSQLCNLPVGG